jgi:hypothetical protein
MPTIQSSTFVSLVFVEKQKLRSALLCYICLRCPVTSSLYIQNFHLSTPFVSIVELMCDQTFLQLTR